MSGMYGLPCDNSQYELYMAYITLLTRKVLNYEVVLSNAAVVSANATSHPDLFWALKGGGNQFGKALKASKHWVLIVKGIVTKFTVRTYPIGQVFLTALAQFQLY